MHTRLLIDAIVRQTMVAIAHLSTVEGVRSPLSHVADRVFLDLVRELEHQGVGKKVIADMFGLALRSYQQKVQRLSESATDQGISLWAAVKGYLDERGSVTKADVLMRFRNDDGASVRGILNDLVSSGLVAQTGRGDTTQYRVVAQDEHLDDPAYRLAAHAALVWVHVYRDGPLERSALYQRLGLDEQELDEALAQLVLDGRITKRDSAGSLRFSADQCVIPLESEAGWEAAVSDHHRAMMTSLILKLRGGSHQSAAHDEMGGSTFTFDLCPGHPKEAEVRALLEETRTKLSALWDEVVAENSERARSPSDYKVTFYFGQAVHQAEEDDQ